MIEVSVWWLKIDNLFMFTLYTLFLLIFLFYLNWFTLTFWRNFTEKFVLDCWRKIIVDILLFNICDINLLYTFIIIWKILPILPSTYISLFKNIFFSRVKGANGLVSLNKRAFDNGWMGYFFVSPTVVIKKLISSSHCHYTLHLCFAYFILVYIIWQLTDKGHFYSLNFFRGRLLIF